MPQIDIDHNDDYGGFGGGGTVPGGKYVAQIIASEDRENSPTANDPNGQHLLLEFEILEGEYAGRSVYTRLNRVNKNPEAVRIAKAELSAICRAAKLTPSDTIDLHQVPMVIDVECVPRKNDPNKKSNNIIGYYSKEEAGETPQATPGDRPWDR